MLLAAFCPVRVAFNKSPHPRPPELFSFCWRETTHCSSLIRQGYIHRFWSVWEDHMQFSKTDVMPVSWYPTDSAEVHSFLIWLAVKQQPVRGDENETSPGISKLQLGLIRFYFPADEWTDMMHRFNAFLFNCFASHECRETGLALHRLLFSALKVGRLVCSFRHFYCLWSTFFFYTLTNHFTANTWCILPLLH